MDGPVPLPDIVICLEAPWDVEKSVVLNMSINLLSYMTNLAFPFGGFGISIYDYDSGYWNNTLKQELNKEYKDILLKTGWNVVELLNKVTFSCEQVIEFCNFGNGVFGYISGSACCKYVFVDQVYGLYGKCFRTSSKFYKFFIKEAGLQSGLNIKLTVRTDILSILNTGITNYPASMSNGVSIGASNKQSHLSTITPKIRGLTPNCMNSAIVSKMTVDRSKQNSPFGRHHCIYENDYQAYQSFTPGYAAYTKDNCILAKKQKFITEKYNCSLIYFNVVTETEYCGPSESVVVFSER